MEKVCHDLIGGEVRVFFFFCMCVCGVCLCVCGGGGGSRLEMLSGEGSNFLDFTEGGLLLFLFRGKYILGAL